MFPIERMLLCIIFSFAGTDMAEHFIGSAFCDEDDHPACTGSAGPPLALDGADLGWHCFVEDHHIGGRHIEAFFADRCRDEDLELPFAETAEGSDLFFLGEPFFCVFCCLPHEPFAGDPVRGKEIHQLLDGVPVGGEDDDPAVGMRFQLFPDEPQGNPSLRVQFFCPCNRSFEELAEGLVGREPLACLAPAGAGPFCDQFREISPEHLASLRLGKHDRMFQLHALGIDGSSRVSRGIAVCNPLLDLGVDRIELPHREFFPFWDGKVERCKEGKPFIDEPVDDLDCRLQVRREINGDEFQFPLEHVRPDVRVVLGPGLDVFNPEVRTDILNFFLYPAR